MKRDRGRWTAGVLSGFALVLFLTACESKKPETSSQAPGEQSMAQESEKREGATPPTPENEKGQPEAAKQRQGPAGPG